MRNTRLAINLLTFLILTAALISPAAAASQTADSKVFIIYSQMPPDNEAAKFADTLPEHLRHFGLASQKISLGEWRQGDLKDAALVIYVGSQKETLPPKMLAEIKSANRIIWFGANIEQLGWRMKWRDFKTNGIAFSRWKINWQGQELFYEWTNVVMTRPDPAAQIIALAESRSYAAPLAWQMGHVSYAAFFDAGQLFLPLTGKLLHEFIPHQHTPSRKILIYAEYIDPAASPKLLRQKTAAFKNRGIPLAIGVSTYGTADGKKVTFADNPELVSALQEAKKNGASLVLRLADENWLVTDAVIQDNLTELRRFGLSPAAFKLPARLLTEDEYTVIARHFKIVYGPIHRALPGGQTQVMAMPYSVSPSAYGGTTFIPDNLGYFNNLPSGVTGILKKSLEISHVPDALAGFSYHYYLPLENVLPILDGIAAQGYGFVDLRLGEENF